MDRIKVSNRLANKFIKGGVGIKEGVRRQALHAINKGYEVYFVMCNKKLKLITSNFNKLKGKKNA